MYNHERWVSFLPVLLAALLLLSVCGVFSGCYTLKQGTTLLGYLGRAVPLEQLASDPANEEFVRRIHDIRQFAMEELGLAMSKNYTSYVELDREYLAFVVSASAKDSFDRHEWHFPVVGSMPYKGFFHYRDARKEREKLEKKDLDVWVRRVNAFSTLGWFKDPLYSYMRHYSPDRLADLIIHELVHATVFIKGHVQFNEELAEFIGSEGARLYMEQRYGVDSEEYHAMLQQKKDNEMFVSVIQELIRELDDLYASYPANGGAHDKTEKLEKKLSIIAAAQERFEAEYEERFSNDDYRGFSKLPVNNAYLELYRLYHAPDNFLTGLYERSGHNLPAFIAAAKTITPKGNPRTQLEQALALE